MRHLLRLLLPLAASLAPNEQIARLLTLGGIDGGATGFHELESGFCNTVYKVDTREKPVVVKLYSAMAKARCAPACRGVVDEAVGNAGLGPKIHVRTDDALVAEFVDGDTLTERDLKDTQCALAIAPTLAQLHALPIPPPLPHTPAALWVGVDAMLNGGGDALDADKLRREAARMRHAVEQCTKADVLGHGDLKPSNVMRLRNGGYTLIDFELAGPNYRGYDIFKLFRTNSLPAASDESLLDFVEAYLGNDADKRAADACLLETKLFEPLTWLEAAIFFSYSAAMLPEKRAEMAALARDRWAAYEDCAGAGFDAAVWNVAR